MCYTPNHSRTECNLVVVIIFLLLAFVVVVIVVQCVSAQSQPSATRPRVVAVSIIIAVDRERGQTKKREPTGAQRKRQPKLPRSEATRSRVQGARARQHVRLPWFLGASGWNRRTRSSPHPLTLPKVRLSLCSSLCSRETIATVLFLRGLYTDFGRKSDLQLHEQSHHLSIGIPPINRIIAY